MAASPVTPKPTAVRKVYYYNWEYDSNIIVRVKSPMVSYQASVLNWLSVWGQKLDLSGFRNLSESEIMSRDIAGEDSKLGLRKVSITLPFDDLIKLDLPVILNLNAAEANLSPWVLLRRAEGPLLTIHDPVRGLVVKRRNDIEATYLEAVGIYFDRDRISEIATDEESRRVSEVQDYLTRNGFLTGSPSGRWDSSTRKAVEKMQKFYHLPETGTLDPITVMLITSRQNPTRPRLFSTEG
jgi:hypothetical protein